MKPRMSFIVSGGFHFTAIASMYIIWIHWRKHFICQTLTHAWRSTKLFFEYNNLNFIDTFAGNLQPPHFSMPGQTSQNGKEIFFMRDNITIKLVNIFRGCWQRNEEDTCAKAKASTTKFDGNEQRRPIVKCAYCLASLVFYDYVGA